MVITLKEANFSLLNIGTLTSVSIIYSIGAGAVYNGPSYVEKNNPLTATITINENYELVENGVTLTMGDNPSSNFIINDNVITINISSVTDRIYIEVRTKKIVKDDVEVVKYNLFNPNDTNATYHLDKYYDHTGALSQMKESNYYYCSTGFIPCKAGDIIRAGRVRTDNGVWQACMSVPCVYYDANYNFIAANAVATDPNGGTDRQYAVPDNSNIAYARCTFRKDFWDICMVTINQPEPPTQFVEYV
jgi:hypothetical protein